MKQIFRFLRLLQKDLLRTETKEITGFIKFVIFEKFFKGIVLLLLSISFLPIFSEEFLEALRFVAHRSHILSNAKIVIRLFGQIADAPDRKLIMLSAFFLFWGVVELLESIGLVRHRRWAEYLIVVSNGIFVPIELSTVLTRFSFEKIGLLVFNIFLILYLVRSRKLFHFVHSYDKHS